MSTLYYRTLFHIRYTSCTASSRLTTLIFSFFVCHVCCGPLSSNVVAIYLVLDRVNFCEKCTFTHAHVCGCQTLAWLSVGSALKSVSGHLISCGHCMGARAVTLDSSDVKGRHLTSYSAHCATERKLHHDRQSGAPSESGINRRPHP